ncbi:hypothetical protein [Streptomyces lonarensis]|uniref:Sulfate adenylyltransferase n=1 Tax=Streptomyces lonarensis TaxID=700599 RepID=A0A7X6D1Z1_9ACTN|nr:hypothetical protein [Streptomyces lonarensis]NJQ06738.1 hypothetical protein [Streptomyces lonarensis]
MASLPHVARPRPERPAVGGAFATFDQAGGRIGSGLRGSGQGGIGRCAP